MNRTIHQPAPHVLVYPIVRPVPRPIASAQFASNVW